MPIINFEVNLISTWSSTCAVTNCTAVETFKTTNTILYVSVVTLSTQSNSILHHQLKSGFKRTVI